MDIDLFLPVMMIVCLVGGVYSSDINSAMSPPFLKNFHEPRESTGRQLMRTVPGYMRKLFKQQKIFSEVSCILSKDYKLMKRPWLTFDLSNMVNLQAASVVTLRLFKRRSKTRVMKELYIIHLYQVYVSSTNHISHQTIVSSRVVDNWRSEWLTFDVTTQTKTTTFKHFLVNVVPFNQNSTLKPVSIGMAGNKRPMLLVFYKKNVKNKSRSKPMESRMVFTAGMSRFPRDVTGRQGDRQYCRRHRLLINFQELGWGQIIIAPRTFSAYSCQGECPTMLGQSMNPSHHSIIQNLYKMVNNDIPSACCVPTELKSITIMYFDDNHNIILKEVPEMSVTSCGCR